MENSFKNPIRKKFKPTSRLNLWKNISKEKWNNWIWQQQNRIKTLDKLKKIINLTDKEKNAVNKLEFRMAITPYYASLMDINNPKCPIRLQCVPSSDEFIKYEGEMEDPLMEEINSKAPLITHKYPDRVLFYTTHNCPVYCRYCTRKRKVSNPSYSTSNKKIEDSLEYIKNNKSIRDVLISGGDPLSNSDNKLEYIIKNLRKINHIEIIRLCTRNPVTLPQRITNDLVNILKKYQPIFVQTHFNHPRECTLEAFDACAKLSNSGSLISNQMVLLKGINDDSKIVKELSHKLLMMRIRPYYMFQCDMVRGVSHFRTPIKKGIEIIEDLRGWTSGLSIPHFVIDTPGGGGKVALVSNNVINKKGKKWIFRNYQNKELTYIDC